MSKSKNKFIFSFLLIGSFIIYTIIQGIGRLTGQSTNFADAQPLPSNSTSDPTTVALNPPTQNSPQASASIPSYTIKSDSAAATQAAAPPSQSSSASSANTSSPAAPAAAATVQAAAPAAAGGGVQMRNRMGNGAAAMGRYRDGVYTGVSADAYYGNVQVQVTVQSGRLTNVQFLDYPHDQQNSQYINSFAVPSLTSEAIAAQSANVDTVSGATETSRAFIQSLSSALSQA